MNNLMTDISITSRAINAFNNLEDEFASIYSKSDFLNMISTIESVGDESARRVNYLPKLYEMFDDCEIAYKKDQNLTYYKHLIDENMNDEKYGAQSVEDRMVFALFDMYENYAEPMVYMDRIVSRLIKKEDKDNWSGDSLRLKILKQFVKYGFYLEDAGYSGRTAIEKTLKAKNDGKKYTAEEAAELIDETIFDVIDNPEISASDKKTKYSLMKLADDLANGKFRTNGATKKGLYLFAMVYDMTIPGFPGASDETDVIKNLFRDYYNNNLMVYLSKGYRDHLREYETDPSGQGVNYKNFTEMIFLYFIVKNIKAVDKIRKSFDMINKVTCESKENYYQREAGSPQGRNTKYYKDRVLIKDRNDNEIVFSEDIFSKDEDTFKKFLLENYACDVRTGKVHESKGKTIEETIAPLQMDLDQNTAFATYQKIMELLNNELKEKNMTIADCNYGLWFDDVSAYRKYGQKNTEKLSLTEKTRYDDFMEILMGANSFIGNNIVEEESSRSEEGEKTETSKVIIKALSVSSAREITRSALMVAFYYYFNCREEDMMWTSYRDLYEVFKSELDGFLLDAGYQEVSAKNLFDVLLTFSSYARTLPI